MVSCTAIAGPASIFTAAEQQWIHDHPVVRYAIDPYWPIEYIEGGEHKGLTRDYIDQIERVSGLRFSLVHTENWASALKMIEQDQIDLSTAVSKHLLDQNYKDKLLLSSEYFVGSTIVVTRSGEPILYSPQKLSGKTVAVKGGGAYEQYLVKHYPGIKLLLINDPEQALEALAEGRADAVVGMDAVLQPIIMRKFFGTLHLAGVLGDMPVISVMGVNPAHPELLAIIDKSLNSITSELSDVMFDRWIAKTKYGIPSWGVIIRYYSVELGLFVLCLIAISIFASRAKRAQKTAQTSEATKTAFLSMMSHEIRTPMNGVLSSIELLQRTEMTAPQLELAMLASVSARSLLDMMDNVLDFSKLEASGVSIEQLPTDVTKLAKGLTAAHHASALEHNTSIIFESSGLADTLFIDPVRVSQIISNLLSNAVKFTQGGTVTLSVKFNKSDLSSGNLTIQVSDTGIGIDPAQQSQLFNAFVQADSSITRRFGGSGLGLFICKQLMDLMGGEIHLNSRLGMGTQVVCTLMVDFEEATAQEKAIAVPHEKCLPIASTPQQVLVVEDNPINQRTIGLQLNELGYHALVVEDGAAALKAIDEHRKDISIVLLDCHLLDMDGYEVARQIRQEEKEQAHMRMPIIAISAATDEHHKFMCVESGIDGILSKPLSLPDIKRLFQLWLYTSNPAPPIEPPVKVSVSLHELFVTTSRDDAARLRNALEVNDVVRSIHYAHRLSGSALTIKEMDLAGLAKELERCLGLPEISNDVCKQLMDAIDSRIEGFASRPAHAN